jgi:hypothetical protein
MKKLSLLIAILAIFTISFASSIIKNSPKKATEIYLPIGNNTKISLMDLSIISVKDYQKISGKHLNFFQRMSFKAGQKQLRNSIAKDGTINNKKLLKAMVDRGDGTIGFNIGWFALGLFLGLIGVLLSYIINGDQDLKRNRQKWAWIGWGVWVVILILTLL